MSIRIALFLIFLNTFTGVFAQEGRVLGSWKSYLPYRAGRTVTQSAQAVFFSTQHGLVSIDKGDLSVQFFSKVDGFTEATPLSVFYHQPTRTLVLPYANSVIDLWDGQEVTTFAQIANFEGQATDKTINRIRSYTDSTILIAANYGLSEFNMRRREFSFTAFSGFPILDAAVFQGSIYVAASDGIFRVDQQVDNLADFGSWELLDEAEGFPPVYDAGSLEVYNGALYLNLDRTVYRYTPEGGLDTVSASAERPVAYLSASGNYLFIGYDRCAQGCGPEVQYLDQDGLIRVIERGCASFRPRGAIEDEAGRVWLGDDGNGFRLVDLPNGGGCQLLDFEGPPSIENYEMTVWENQLWMASGGLNQNLGNRFVQDGFSSLIDGDWSTYSIRNFPIFEADPDDFNDNYLDFITVAVHPSTGVVYAGSFMRGLARWDGEEMQVFNETNSPLQSSVVFEPRTRVAGLAFDESNTLWMVNSEGSRGLVSLDAEENWSRYDLCGDPSIATYQVAIDQSGFKWITAWGGGVYAFDEGDPEDPADDRCRFFTPQNSNLPSNRVRCVAVDLDGEVWVGTEKGVVIFECGSGAFEDICQGTLRIVEQDGFNAFLLETENVRTIAVDGANRKWIGTDNGIFVLSPDGEEQILRFTEENSPLFSNTVQDIAIDPERGEVFIGTLRGIQSYLSGAISGGRVHRAEIEVFPNPVRPDYRGPITIRGLPRDAIVKITDLSGRLVRQVEALGGQAIWDGTDYNGRRVATGVYLILSSSNPDYAGFDGRSDAEVGKVVFVN